MSTSRLQYLTNNKKIWIDLDNSPHVPFFKPIIRELKSRGFTVVITARDCSQTCGLADYYNLTYKRMGRHFGKNKILKVLGLVVRACGMIPFVLKERPQLAVSHGSRSQLLIAKLLSVQSISMDDYEHSKELLIVYPEWFLSPEIIPHDDIKFKKSCFLSYPGIKEDVYVPEFKPDPDILNELNINSQKLIVTVRPPATQAHYHNPQADKLLKAVIDYIGQNQNACMVLMPRYDEQEKYIREEWSGLCRNGQIIIPDHVVNGLNLIWHSDLVISGGGTMNREAAVLGVPVYSIFRGKLGAVDKYLSDSGQLIILKSIEDVKLKIIIKRREAEEKSNIGKRETLKSIVDIITKIAGNELDKKGILDES